jgi:signal transduction histidine kinase
LAQCHALRQANRELRRLQSLTDAIVSSIPAGTAVWSEDLCLTYANPAFCELFHCSPEAVGSPLAELVSRSHREAWADSLRHVLRTGETVVEHSFPHPICEDQGAAVSLHLSRVEAARGEGGASGGEGAALGGEGGAQVLMVAEDVSDRETLHRQLVVSEKLAAMGLLSAGVAHELRTPLSVIRLAAFDVKDMLDDAVPDASEQMDLIEKNVLQCNHIVESLLNFARESPLEPRQLDLNQLVRDCLDIARRQIAVQDIVVERQFAQLPPIRAPEEDLKQVVSNTILNAVQAMPDGGYLTIASKRLDDERVRVEVADTGEGIPAEDIDRIFDPFFTTKDPGEGTGLGLSICRKIMSKMGGSITVRSTRGEGSVFRIDFPLEARGDAR